MSRAPELLRVFVHADGTGGNPLAVVDATAGMSTEEMLAITDAYGFSETTFVTEAPQKNHAARVRIFTPGKEMAFAGHPTLGTADVLARWFTDAAWTENGGTAIGVGLSVGVIPVSREGDTYELCANRAAPREWTPNLPGNAAQAAMFGLPEAHFASDACWFSSGTEQLIVPFHDAADLAKITVDVEALARFGANCEGRANVYAIAWESGDPEEAHFRARYFFRTPDGALAEDPGTGSACANFGAWLLAHRPTWRRPRMQIQQGLGLDTNALCTLGLRIDGSGEAGTSFRIDADARIYVRGRVAPLR